MADQRTRAASAPAASDDDDATPTPRAAAQAAAAEVAPEDPKFPVERLVNESEAFGLGASFITAGALSTLTKKNLTLAEAQAAIKAFLATEV